MQEPRSVVKFIFETRSLGGGGEEVRFNVCENTRWFTRSVLYQTALNGRHFTPGTEE